MDGMQIALQILSVQMLCRRTPNCAVSPQEWAGDPGAGQIQAIWWVRNARVLLSAVDLGLQDQCGLCGAE